MLTRLLLVGLVAFSAQAAFATLINVELGSQISNRAISYGGPGGDTAQEFITLTAPGVTVGSAANDHGSSSMTATIVSNANDATFQMDTLLTKTTTGRVMNNRMDVAFSVTSAVNYVFTGLLSGTSTDAIGVGDQFDTHVHLVNLAGGSLFGEDDLAFGTAVNFGIDGIGSLVSGSAIGILGPGNYKIRMESRLVDFDADALGDATLTGGFRLNLSAVTVPEPASLVLFGLGLLAMGVKRRQI